MNISAMYRSFLFNKAFFPLFITQFLGAFNDNLFKNAFVILIAYGLISVNGYSIDILVTSAAGVFILPFLLFSRISGQLADKLEKSALTQKVKLAEIGVMAFGGWGLYLNNLWILFIALFLMGVQSTFFGPLKYSILPSHVEQKDYTLGNAYISGGTFLAILLGTILGPTLIRLHYGALWVIGVVLFCSLFGWFASHFILKTPPHPEQELAPWVFKNTSLSLIISSLRQRNVRNALLAISWFWFLGAGVLSQMPTLAGVDLFGTETIFTVLLCSFVLGIGAGAFFCSFLLKGRITLSILPLSALGISFFLGDSYFSVLPTPVFEGMERIELVSFISEWSSWRIIADFGGFAFCGGMYIVPLYSFLQSISSEQERARLISANNILNALFMIASSIFILVLQFLNMSITEIFAVFSLLNIVIVFFSYRYWRKH